MSDANTPDGFGGEVLSQSEVERLLSQVQVEEAQTTVLNSSGEPTRRKMEDIQSCDFRQPAFLAPNELRNIRLRHEEFIRSLAAHLSIHLRVEFTMRMSKLQTLTYQKFVESLPNPTHLILFKAEPLKGICLLQIPPHLALTVVDRLLGGPGHSANANRDLTEIEAALLDQVAQIMLSEWCNGWQKLLELRPVKLGHETHGRFIHTCPHDTVMLTVAIETVLGDCVESLQIAFPYYTIEPLVRQLNSQINDNQEIRSQTTGTPRWNPGFGDILIPLTAQGLGLEMSSRQLAELRPGDTMMVDPSCFNRIQVSLAGVPKFVGRLGSCGNNWAVELTEVLASASDMASPSSS